MKREALEARLVPRSNARVLGDRFWGETAENACQFARVPDEAEMRERRGRVHESPSLAFAVLASLTLH